MTLNPYFKAGSILANRLRWDLKLESWKERKRLRKMKGLWLGQKAVILCNGPSLNKVDFDVLTRVKTIGLNKVNLLFDRTDFRPDYIVAINRHVIEQNAEFYNLTEIPLFLNEQYARKIQRSANRYFLHLTSLKRFAKDVSMSIYSGHTVTFAALQLAYYMGFQEVALVGCDHNFTEKGPANKEVKARDIDESHFSPDYFSKGVTWELPDLIESEIGYLLALKAFEEEGRRIVNCTEGGKLEIFPRQRLNEFLTHG